MKESALYEEIKDEGRVERGQADVLTFLEERFGERSAASVREAVQGVTELDKLNRLVRLAARCGSVEEFQRGLRRR